MKALRWVYVFVLIFSLTGCAWNDSPPRMEITADLLPISEEEFKNIPEGSKPRDDLKISDVKKLAIEVRMENGKGLEQTKIVIPEIHSTIDKHDRIRSIMSGGTGSELNSTHATAYVIFDSRDLDSETIKGIYQNKTIKVTWVKDGQPQNQTFSMEELLRK